MLDQTKPMCWTCGLEMKPYKNGVRLIEMAHFGPAAIWAADLWHCEECQAEVVAGLGRQPITEHYDPDFGEELARTGNGEWTRQIWVTRTEKQQYAGVGAEREKSNGS